MTKHRHFIIHKPYGFLSQFVHNERKRRNRRLLGELYDFPEGCMSVGRLDEASEGLLLITTDGIESDRIRSKDVEKEYYVQVDGEITDEAIELMKNGVEISIEGKKYHTLPGNAFKLDPAPEVGPRAKKVRSDRHGPSSWVSITISEGKYRQVRKMTAAVGFPTLRLIRVRIGKVTLGDLKSGEVVEVEKFEYK